MNKRYLVMEGDNDEEIPVDNPSGDGASDSTDSPSVPGSGSPKEADSTQDTPPGDVTGAEESDTGIDPAEGGDDPLSMSSDDPNAEPDKPPVDPDTPIELEVTDDLQVDRLKELTDKDDLKELKKTEVEDTISSASTDLISLENILLSLVQASENDRLKLIPSSLDRLKEIRTRQGFNDVSLEHLIASGTLVTTESFVSTIRTLFAAIVKAILKIIEWVKERFKTFFTEVHWIADSTKRITDLVMTKRKTYISTFRHALKAKLIDEENYVSLPLEKAYLTYQGKQPGGGMKIDLYDSTTGSLKSTLQPSYADCFMRLIDIATMHETYSSKSFLSMCDAMPLVVEAINQDQEYPAIAGEFDIYSTILPNSQPVMHFHGQDSSEDCRMYVSDGYLGCVAVLVEVPYVVEDQTARNKINQLHMWKVGMKKEHYEINNASLRYLYDEEIIEGSKASAALSDELIKMRRSVDVFNDQSNKLKNLLVKLENSPAVSNLDQSAEGAERVKQYTEVLQAVQSILRNSSTALDSAGTYCRKIQYAWIMYLNEVYKRDLGIIKSVT